MKKHLIASQDKTILLWNISTGNINKKISENKASIDCLFVMPDGSLVSGSFKELRIWNMELSTTLIILEPYLLNVNINTLTYS